MEESTEEVEESEEEIVSDDEETKEIERSATNLVAQRIPEIQHLQVEISLILYQVP